MAIPPLVYLTNPARIIERFSPAALRVRLWKVEPLPSERVRRLLKHAAETPHVEQRRLEAALVLTVALLAAVSHQRPALTRWMRHDWMRPVICACVALLCPQINEEIVRVV